MGRFLEAHTTRYIDSGDFPAFWLGFDAALNEDALATRRAAALYLPGMFPASAVLGIWNGRTGMLEPAPPPPAPTFTPEELLAALAPPKVAPQAPAKTPIGWWVILAAWEDRTQPPLLLAFAAFCAFLLILALIFVLH